MRPACSYLAMFNPSNNPFSIIEWYYPIENTHSIMFLPTHKEIEMNSKVQNGTLYLSGDITVKTVNVVAYQQFQQACQQNIHTLDLAGVTQADSACISLLLAALRQAPHRPALHHLPAAVQALSELYEIQDWLHPSA